MLNCVIVLNSEFTVTYRNLFFLQHSFAGTYLTLHELWKRAISRCNPLLSTSWNYCITHYKAGLVGLLSTSVSNGYWTLSDATRIVPCVLAHDAEDFVNLHGAVVLLMKCILVTELYQVRQTSGVEN